MQNGYGSYCKCILYAKLFTKPFAKPYSKRKAESDLRMPSRIGKGMIW